MPEIELVAINGLDSAIIGTALRGELEVLAYDFEKTVSILLKRGSTIKEAEEYVADLAARDFEGAPIFIYIDEIYGHSPGAETTVH